MTEKQIYIEIAQRYINCCLEQIANNSICHEAIGFKTYHAFESIAGAFNSHIGQPVSMKHERKLNSFVENYQRNRFARVDPRSIARLSITLNSLRNKFLYPDPTPSGLVAPKDQLTFAQVRQLTSQVNGIITHIVAAI